MNLQNDRDTYPSTIANSKMSPSPRLLKLKLSSSFLPQLANSTNTSTNLVTNPTTAVTLANANQADIAIFNETDDDNLLNVAPLNRYSLTSGTSPLLTADSSEDEGPDANDSDSNELASLFRGLISESASNSQQGEISYETVRNVFSQDRVPLDKDFILQRIACDKQGDSTIFRKKLKHFFILSTAGKPIYSLNGSDDLIMGYMGLITTIVSTFQEGLNSELRYISHDNFTLSVMNKSPLLLVAVTKLPREFKPSTGSIDGPPIIETQLKVIYNYILGVLSKLAISKNFDKRMNYDLRNILSHQDFKMLDTICMKLTYGFNLEAGGEYEIDNSFYLETLLNNAVQCAIIKKTTRDKLNSIMISTKKLKVKQHSSNGSLIILDKILGSDKERYIASDLLFGFLTFDKKILSYLRPKSHHLNNEDIRMLISTTSELVRSQEPADSPEMWVPLCMPNFNDSGFLYVFVKQVYLPGSAMPIIISLLSGNKNSFYDMKEVANYVIYKIQKSETFTRTLAGELAHISTSIPVLKDLSISSIRHFIYKHKGYNQLYMDNPQYDGSMEYCLRALSHVNHLYASLRSSKATVITHGVANPKRLTYTRWQLENVWVTGFLLEDEKSEFYCICGGAELALLIIEESLRIIRWCEKYKRRLFVADGTAF